ncbi:MAG: hypothetical protein ABIQ39_13390 [Ilumatobacteraceae bacterium]
MSNVPEGAQLSDDGQWYWDGSEWKAVEGGATGGEQAATADPAGTNPEAGRTGPAEIAFNAEAGNEPDLPDVDSEGVA